MLARIQARVIFAAVLSATSAASYAAVSVENIKNASGDTPINFVDCEGQGGCAVLARFSDMQACDRYRSLFHASCRSTARPGFIICQRFDQPRRDIAAEETYCIPAP